MRARSSRVRPSAHRAGPAGAAIALPPPSERQTTSSSEHQSRRGSSKVPLAARGGVCNAPGTSVPCWGRREAGSARRWTWRRARARRADGSRRPSARGTSPASAKVMPEHVVEQERGPFGGRESLENDQQGELDRLDPRSTRSAGPPAAIGSTSGSGSQGPTYRLAPRACAPESVECEPRLRRSSAMRAGRAPRPPRLLCVRQSQPGLLDDIFGFGDRAERGVCHAHQMGAIGLKGGGEADPGRC